MDPHHTSHSLLEGHNIVLHSPLHMDTVPKLTDKDKDSQDVRSLLTIFKEVDLDAAESHLGGTRTAFAEQMPKPLVDVLTRRGTHSVNYTALRTHSIPSYPHFFLHQRTNQT